MNRSLGWLLLVLTACTPDVPAAPSTLEAELGPAVAARDDLFELHAEPSREGTDYQVDVTLRGDCADGVVAGLSDPLLRDPSDPAARNLRYATRSDAGWFSFVVRTRVSGDPASCEPLTLELHGSAVLHEDVASPTTRLEWRSAGAVPVDR